MKHFFRTLLLLLASVGVMLLGYYAYILTTDTLSLPFVGQEKQSGTLMQFVVARPKFLMSSYTHDVIDQDALIQSMTLDGKPFDPTISGEGTITISGEYVAIAANKMTGSSILKIDATKYNSARSTQYRLPRDMFLAETKNPKEFSIAPEGEPREKSYSVRLVGYSDLAPRDVKWYMHTDASKNCYVSDVWNSLLFTSISTEELSSDRDGQIQTGKYRLYFDSNTPRLCIIAGIGGEFYTVEDRYLDTFTATGLAVDILSPEYDMQSRIEFQFSSDIYRDKAELYSKEYMSHRKNQKTLFLKSLDIRPNIALTEDNIALYPNRVSIVAPFEEGKDYSISLNGLTDIYGRTVDTKLDFTPVRTPFLSLGLSGKRTMFRFGEPVGAKMYALKTPKQEYALSLCHISLEGYARSERMIAENDKKYTDNLYELLKSSDVSQCVKKDIVVNQTNSISSFDVREFILSGSLDPGLYILAFRDKDDISSFDRFIAPRIFSVIDTQVTLKVDASGKIQVLTSDITTGEPRPNQTISLLQNIGRTYTETWNPTTYEYDKSYLPITNSYFATSVYAGTTGSGGILKTKKDSLVENDYNSLYGLSSEPYWDYEGRYSSFLTTSSGGGHFGYVVSTWNDGITGWNFGLKDSDYSWDTRPEYSSYIHTDRLLYLPGDTVNIHAILRKNDAKLTIPNEEKFQIRVTDPIGSIIKEGVYTTNEFGSLSLELNLPSDAHLGSYTINLELVGGQNSWSTISNSWASFQVEVFKNPTFTASVSLRSPDIEEDVLLNLREVTNDDPSTPWYADVYESTFSLEGIVKAKYYNGQSIRNIPFSYRIYRSEYFDDTYWKDCFWGCFWQPSPEFYTEGTGTIDSDGFGFFRIPVSFSSFYSDYMYTAEVIIRDPMTGEEVVTPATILAKIPEKYKSYAQNNPLIFTPSKRIVSHGENISGTVSPQYGKWDSSLEEKYYYEVVSRSYTQIHVDDLRLSDITIPISEDVVVQSGMIVGSGISIDTKGFKSGEYHFRILPITPEGILPPPETISDISFYVVGDFTTRSYNLQVIPEKTIYKLGETARVLITLPFTGGHLYLTKEKGGVIESEYVPIEGNTMIREYLIDETTVPNVYIGAVAFNIAVGTGSRAYAVGYGELITDLSEKRANLQIETNKATYSNRENVDVLLSLSDKEGKPLEGEVTLMVIDESLIRLLGNIDIDIIPKFFQKFPFTMKTSLTAIGMERNRFLSRKGSNGGSGDKGGGGVQISSRTLFKNTAYYNASVRTNNAGKAKVTFQLPDNVTDYRIIAIAQTKKSQFGVKEKTIQVRRDYTLETHAPYIVYPGDTTTITASAFNATKKVTQAKIILQVGTGSSGLEDTKEVIMNPSEGQSASFTLNIRDTWKGDLPYKLSLMAGDTTLDSVEKTLKVRSIPLIESTQRKFGIFSSGTKMVLTLSDIEDMSLLKSRVVFRISSSLMVGMDAAIQSLLVYPYGCIEQTIASTLPNALALKLSSILGSAIDAKLAKNNLDAGLKKILRMQQFGGWKYWETDTEINTHVTPYVLRSLLIFKDLGSDIPQSALDAGVKYVEDMVEYRGDLYKNDMDFAAEIFWTLALVKSDKVKLIEKSIDPKKLTRHGYLAYAYGLQILGRYTTDIDKKLESIIKQKTGEYWYWDAGSDLAIYARLLLERGNIDRATTILDDRLRSVDLSSYYVSTQEKIQLFYSLYKHTLLTSLKGLATNIALRGESIIADLSLTKDRLSQKIEAPRGKMGDEISINRSGTSPLFFELTEYNVPDDIMNISPQSAGGIGVVREFERIDESRGIAKDGSYIGVTPMTETTFEKGQLYRATIRVKIPEKNSSWQHLSVEDFVPGGWRPIQGVFQTTSQMNAESSSEYNYDNYWTYVETRDDRILATVQSGYGSTRSYTYYFRPEFSGIYLLPPVTTYFMYRPEVHAIGRYQIVTVK